jgi:hypothetical protein
MFARPTAVQGRTQVMSVARAGFKRGPGFKATHDCTSFSARLCPVLYRLHEFMICFQTEVLDTEGEVSLGNLMKFNSIVVWPSN